MSVPVVLHPRFPRGVDSALAEVEGIELRTPPDSEAVAAELADAPVLVTFVWQDDYLTESLGWIQSISAGVDQFPAERLSERGVVLTSARGVHGPQMAEHAFALLLALTRGVGIAMREAEHRRWRQRMGDEIAGRTIAVLGLGAIGEEIAQRAAAWGMEVIGTKRHPDGYRGAAREVFGPEDTMEVCRRADVVVSVLPDSPETRHLIDAEALEALGAGWLVNVGRGSVVDEVALVAALDDGDLLGVGLDVFETEPLPEDSPLWSHPRVVITPHTAGLSPAYGPRLAEILTDNLAAFAGEGPWRNRVV